jgi:Protein of unknown function (DUF2786)
VTGEDAKLEVIRKLLAKAERAATPDEATAYNTKAAEMMARHGVDAAMLAASGVTEDRIGELRIAMTDPYSTEKCQLANSVGAALGCKTLRHPGYRRGTVDAVTMFGFESDLQRAEVLFTSLLLQATRQVVTQRPPSWTGESTAAFRRTWLVGFSREVYRRLLDAERRATQQHDMTAPSAGHSAALVVANRHAVVDARFGEQYPGLRAGRRRTLTGSGFRLGAAAGRQADLGGPRLANKRRELGP